MKTELTEDGTLMFWCPGCETHHGPRVSGDKHPLWTWNGDREKPTLTPSIVVRTERPTTDDDVSRLMRGESIDASKTRVCHSFVTDGRIQFLGDCTHALAGQTVDLPDME